MIYVIRQKSPSLQIGLKLERNHVAQHMVYAVASRRSADGWWCKHSVELPDNVLENTAVLLK
jgi:hypothetical protein